MEERSRQTTVLFADVSGSTSLYETEGDAAALDAIGLCIGRLSQALRATSRSLYSITIKGKADRGELCEIEWRPVSEATNDPGPRPEARSAAAALRLSYRDLQLVRRRQNDLVVIGRDASCGLVIAGQNVSRLHCSIARRDDRFVLRDHSTNGTFVTVDGDAEIQLQGEDMPLRTHGWLALGEPRADTAEVVAYSID